ncbi:Aste57867_12676 [Aphanomyces stellatus]|uniref:Aste57867_12676 protein n=1 Tax=Aphanomyces stellatus TaxID=120398 RepID=A0A485KW72_9STRA|nr:hypothetical protein As57867_012629 [Aphanomyces stellatus]VFT89526.1 Aste57867_12676 [Aphanomyces stellatus]
MPHTSLAYSSGHLGLDKGGSGTWTLQEHRRFLEAMRLYPDGPWKRVAAIVGTRSVRQIRTHAQKCKEKIARHERGLRIKPARRRKAMHCVDSLSRSPRSPSSSPEHLMDLLDPLSLSTVDGLSRSPRSPTSSSEYLIDLLDPLFLDEVDDCMGGCEPLTYSCSEDQLEECLVFLSDALDANNGVEFEL